MLLLALAALAAPAAAAADEGPGTTLLRELNRVRARAHLAALRLDRRMCGAADAYSGHMARTRSIGHGNWSARVARSAGGPSRSGEVIGWLTAGSPQAEAPAIVRTWLASPIHRHVLLDGAFRRVGIGRARAALGGGVSAIYTVDFASAR